jgi:hypothetical protein
MGMLFHTKEFPKGLKTVGPQAKEKENDCLLDDSYCYRNVLWLFGLNKLYILNGKQDSTLFKKLIWTESQQGFFDMMAIDGIGWDSFWYKVDQGLFGISWINIEYFADLKPYIFLGIS